MADLFGNTRVYVVRKSQCLRTIFPANLLQLKSKHRFTQSKYYRGHS